MQVQDTARPAETQYRGAEWTKIQNRGRLRSPALEAQPSATPPRLGSSTHFDTYRDAVRSHDGPSYLATLKRYGHNGAELVLRTVHETPNLYRRATRARKYVTGTPRADADPFTVQKSAWRARSSIKEWVRMMCTPDRDHRLVTLTARGGIPTLDDCWRHVGAFRRELDKHYPGAELLAVPELHHGQGQNRDTFHVHCVLVMPKGVRPIYSVFHRMWYRALGGSGLESSTTAPGNCDFARTHGRDGRKYTACQAARYLSKYITKDLWVGNVGQKRFTTSHGAPTPATSYWWQPISASWTLTRSHCVTALRRYFPADAFAIYSRTFTDGGDTYHVFSAEPAPS